jgi:hypothetical protein
LPTHFLDIFGLVYCYDERDSDVPANYEKIGLTTESLNLQFMGLQFMELLRIC